MDLHTAGTYAGLILRWDTLVVRVQTIAMIAFLSLFWDGNKNYNTCR